MHKYYLEIFYRLLRCLTGRNIPFGGKNVIMGSYYGKFLTIVEKSKTIDLGENSKETNVFASIFQYIG